MEKQVYITEEERAKCQKVVDAFAELYEMADIVVVNVGRYGFVMLKYYMPSHGFEDDATFTDSGALFEGLWQEWNGLIMKLRISLEAQAKLYVQDLVKNKKLDWAVQHQEQGKRLFYH